MGRILVGEVSVVDLQPGLATVTVRWGDPKAGEYLENSKGDVLPIIGLAPVANPNQRGLKLPLQPAGFYNSFVPEEDLNVVADD